MRASVMKLEMEFEYPTATISTQSYLLFGMRDGGNEDVVGMRMLEIMEGLEDGSPEEMIPRRAKDKSFIQPVDSCVV